MNRATTARALDREADERRQRLASTLDELSASLTPGRILDEVLSYAKGGGGNFLMGLGKSASANPLPTLLISTGCALLLSGKGGSPFTGAGKQNQERSSRTEYERSLRAHEAEGPGVLSRAAGAVSGAASNVADKVGSVAGNVTSVASDVSSRAVDNARDAFGTFADTATGAGEALTQVGERARDYTQVVADTARETAENAQRRATLFGRELNGKAVNIFTEYPIAVAAGGLLVGAALAALLPRSKIEDRYRGEASDTLKGSFADGAGDSINRVATSVENIVGVVTAKAGEEDIFGAAKGSLDKLSAKVGNTLQAGKDAIDEELKGSAAGPAAHSGRVRQDGARPDLGGEPSRVRK